MDSTPESLLQFLTAHRESTQRRRDHARRFGARDQKTPRLSRAVTALVLLGASVLVWGSFTHFRFVSRAPAAANAARHSAAVAPAQTSAATAPVAAATKTKRTTAQSRDDLWHRGFQAWPDPAHRRLPDVYFEWLHSNFACAAYASYGCWKAKVVTRHGCPHGFNILVDETQNGAKVGLATAFIARLRPKAPKIIEVDADRGHVDGRVTSMSCN